MRRLVTIMKISFRECSLAESRARSPGPLFIELPLYMGFTRISSGTDWVSENSVHRNLAVREDPFSAVRDRAGPSP